MSNFNSRPRLKVRRTKALELVETQIERITKVLTETPKNSKEQKAVKSKIDSLQKQKETLQDRIQRNASSGQVERRKGGIS